MADATWTVQQWHGASPLLQPVWEALLGGMAGTGEAEPNSPSVQTADPSAR
jgi:hypothetical protein